MRGKRNETGGPSEGAEKSGRTLSKLVSPQGGTGGNEQQKTERGMSLVKALSPEGVTLRNLPMGLDDLFKRIGSKVYGLDWRPGCLSSLDNPRAGLGDREAARIITEMIIASLIAGHIQLGAYFQAGTQTSLFRQRRASLQSVDNGSSYPRDEEDEDSDGIEGVDTTLERRLRVKDKYYPIDPKCWTTQPTSWSQNKDSAIKIDYAKSRVTGLQLEHLIAGYVGKDSLTVAGSETGVAPKLTPRSNEKVLTLANIARLEGVNVGDVHVIVWRGYEKLNDLVKIIPKRVHESVNPRTITYFWGEIAAACWRYIVLSKKNPKQLNPAELSRYMGSYLSSRGYIENSEAKEKESESKDNTNNRDKIETKAETYLTDEPVFGHREMEKPSDVSLRRFADKLYAQWKEGKLDGPAIPDT